MALKERNHGKFANKFCNVVDELITLEELGFKEDGFHNWNYIIRQSDDSPHYSKSLVAAGDYLYLRDQQGDKYTDVSLCALWSRGIGGPIRKETIKQFINLLEAGNVRQ
tara:strand:+ start:54317 stop:54643 length:327 start_codon:yes stop_codon:yes gene_type:complete